MKVSPYLLFKNNGNDTIQIYNISTLKNDNESRQNFNKISRGQYDLLSRTDLNYLRIKQDIVDDDFPCPVYHPQAVEIETTTICNWSCVYCPNHYNKRERKVMSMVLFQNVLNKIVDHKSIQYVTFHFYNEPTIDPLFKSRLVALAKTRLKLLLFTNGTGLNKDLLDYLKSISCVESIYFSLPTIDRTKFSSLTNSNTDVEEYIDKINYARKIGLNIHISVQGTDETKDLAKEQIKKTFSLKDDYLASWDTFDRAGLIKNEDYFKNTNINAEKLFGCLQIMQHLYVDIEGNLIICDQDYRKENVFGNILNSDLDSEVNSVKATILRRQIFGLDQGNDTLICRKCQRMQQMKIVRLFSEKVFNS